MNLIKTVIEEKIISLKTEKDICMRRAERLSSGYKRKNTVIGIKLLKERANVLKKNIKELESELGILITLIKI